jgi:hypothetical protein
MVQTQGLPNGQKGHSEVVGKEISSETKNSFIDILLQPEYSVENQMPFPLKRDIKKKKKRGMSI